MFRSVKTVFEAVSALGSSAHSVRGSQTPESIPRSGKTILFFLTPRASEDDTTPFIIGSEVDVWCVFVFGPWRWLDQNQNTRNVYLQTDDKRCT